MSMTDIQGDLSDAERALLNGALALAEQGIMCFPVMPNGKVPRISSEESKWGATKEPEEITAYWTGRYKGHNVAIPTGSRTGIWALDIDVKGEHNGFDTLAKHTAEHGPLPDTLTIDTPSGGRHYLFQHEEGISNSAGKRMGNGIDVRGDDGLIVTVPSVIDGKPYRIVADSEFDEPKTFSLSNIAKAPEWLVAMARKPKHGPEVEPEPPKREGLSISERLMAQQYQGGPRPGQPTSPERVDRYIQGAIQRELDDLASARKGRRNDQLNESAFALGQLITGVTQHFGPVVAARHQLFEERMTDFLVEGAKANGVYQDDGHQAAMDSIRSGLVDGMAIGRTFPDFTPRDKRMPGERDRHPERKDGQPEGEWEEDTGPRKPPREALGIKSSDEFLKAWKPSEFIVKPIIERGRVYTLTGPTGTGKTAVALLMAAQIATGNPLPGNKVKQGLVLFLAGENHEDVRTRWLAITRHGLLKDLQVDFREGFFDLEAKEQVLSDLILETQPTVVMVDTLQAFFNGDDSNSNEQVKALARVFRRLANLGPAILVPAHPTKSVTRETNVPYGGGALLNEIDGNLSLWGEPECVTLHWTGKFRGSFEPIKFAIDVTYVPGEVDGDGDPIKTVMARVLSDAEETKAESKLNERQLRMLLVMDERATPWGFRELIRTYGDRYQDQLSQATGNRLMGTLASEKMVEKRIGKWRLTPRGLKEIRPQN